MLKKDKIASCVLFGYTNWSDKNSNIITLVPIITMLLYHRIFWTLAYLMPVAYSKPCQLSQMMRHIEKPG